MNINETIDSVILKHDEGPPIDDDDFVKPPRPKRDDDVEMDITPMIDITFLLLIFFLVASRPDTTTSVNLPIALHGDVVSQRKATVFSVGEGGIDQAPVYAADGKTPGTELPPDIEARNEAIQKLVRDGVLEGKTNVVIKADRGVACRDIDSLLKAISKVEGVTINLGVLDKNL